MYRRSKQFQMKENAHAASECLPPIDFKLKLVSPSPSSPLNTPRPDLNPGSGRRNSCEPSQNLSGRRGIPEIFQTPEVFSRKHKPRRPSAPLSSGRGHSVEERPCELVRDENGLITFKPQEFARKNLFPRQVFRVRHKRVPHLV